MAICSCDPGFIDNGSGACVSSNPCAPNPCTAPGKGVCTAQGMTAVCSCNVGTQDDGTGTCRSTTPCTPNPCTATNQTVCTANGFGFTCGCDVGTVQVGSRCVLSGCAAQHSTGDALEPNECASQAATLPLAAAGLALNLSAVTIAPTSGDVDFYAIPGAPSHVYWALLDADASMCTTATVPVPTAVSPAVRFAGQVSASTTFSCVRNSSQVTLPSYRVGVLDFDLSDGDYSNSLPAPTVLAVGKRRATNTVNNSSDTLDVFSFTATGNTTLTHVGQSIFVRVFVRDPATNVLLASATASCLQRLQSSACVNLTISGTVKVVVEVGYEPIYAVDSPSLTAWTMGW